MGKVIEATNSPPDIETYECGDEKVKVYRSIYDVKKWNFKGIVGTLGLIVIFEDGKETYFSYGFDIKKSKLLHSGQKRRTPNTFFGTLFNKHKNMIMNDEVEQEFSKILLSFFILSSIADKKENINQYMDTVSLHPVDLSQAEVRKLRENFLDLEPQNLKNFSKKRNVGRNCMFFALKHNKSF